MIQYISELGLPKEYSKKKKFELLTAMIIPEDNWKDTDIKWPINYDLQRMYLTIEEASKAAIIKALEENEKKSLNNDYIAIAVFTYPALYLNDTPLARDTMDNAIDCNWDEKTLSFDFTIRKIRNKISEYGWEDLHISTLKIDNCEAIKNDDNKWVITNLNMYPVVDMTTF